ncbi:TetR/AcrR family transcriptional regulator [Paenibacillus sp. WLX1005]|uniref:TetR/AcrR family transcriptional regulator n=1 Tax=Paenibacillus sp. WLX1005 TaxID=3243766 RepID=UPI003984157C
MMKQQQTWHQQLRNHHREELVQAGATLFLQRNFPDITVKDVCDQAGISRVTFYKHFRDINELVLDVQIHILRDMTERLTASDLPQTNGRQRLAGILQAWVDYACTHGKELRFVALFDLYYEQMQVDDELRQRYEQFVQHGTGRDFLQNALEQGVRDGSLKPQLDVSHAGVLIFQTVMGVLQRVSMTSTPELQDRHEGDVVVQPVIDMLLDYVAAQQ